LVCGGAAILSWFVARFPHTARAAALIVVALLFAASYNAAQPLGLPWLPSPDGRVGLPRAYEPRLPQIDAPEALRLFLAGEVLFVDSRDAEDYGRDHIPGAVNVPMREWNDFEPDINVLLPRDRTLVLYCYGAHCGLSTRQGKRLLGLGYERLLVLDYGWAAWTKASSPTARHPDGKASGNADAH
jgi:rhodanese-related sulfurtransferase